MVCIQNKSVSSFLGIPVVLNFSIGLGASRILRRGECQGPTIVGPYGPWPEPAQVAEVGVQRHKQSGEVYHQPNYQTESILPLLV